MSLYDVLKGAGLLDEPRPDDLLTPEKAGAIIGLSARRVQEAIRTGALAAVNLGNAGRGARYFVRRADAEAFAAQPRRGRGRPPRG